MSRFFIALLLLVCLLCTIVDQTASLTDSITVFGDNASVQNVAVMDWVLSTAGKGNCYNSDYQRCTSHSQKRLRDALLYNRSDLSIRSISSPGVVLPNGNQIKALAAYTPDTDFTGPNTLNANSPSVNKPLRVGEFNMAPDLKRDLR